MVESVQFLYSDGTPASNLGVGRCCIDATVQQPYLREVSQNIFHWSTSAEGTLSRLICDDLEPQLVVQLSNPLFSAVIPLAPDATRVIVPMSIAQGFTLKKPKQMKGVFVLLELTHADLLTFGSQADVGKSALWTWTAAPCLPKSPTQTLVLGIAQIALSFDRPEDVAKLPKGRYSVSLSSQQWLTGYRSSLGAWLETPEITVGEGNVDIVIAQAPVLSVPLEHGGSVRNDVREAHIVGSTKGGKQKSRLRTTWSQTGSSVEVTGIPTPFGAPYERYSIELVLTAYDTLTTSEVPFGDFAGVQRVKTAANREKENVERVCADCGVPITSGKLCEFCKSMR